MNPGMHIHIHGLMSHANFDELPFTELTGSCSSAFGYETLFTRDIFLIKNAGALNSSREQCRSTQLVNSILDLV